MKKYLLFGLLALIFFFVGNVSQASAAYGYEGIGFYAYKNSMGYASEGIAFYVPKESSANTIAIYRYYSSLSDDHFYMTENKDMSSFSYVNEGLAFYAYTSQENNTFPVYRFYNKLTGNHFYTSSESEKNILQNNPQWGHQYEGIVFYAKKDSSSNLNPVYRLYNSATDDHLYTISENEKNTLALSPVYRYYNATSGDHFYFTKNKDLSSFGYKFEGIAFYAHTEDISGSTPVYKYYNSVSGDHFYTIQNSTFSGYSPEGVAFYAHASQDTNTFPVYRFYESSNGDHFYTISEAEKNYLQQGELGQEISVGLWNYSTSSLKSSPFKLTANKNYVIKDSNGNILGSVSGNSTTRVTYDKDSYLKIYESISSAKSKKVVYFEAADGDNAGIIFDVNRPDSSYDQYRGKITVRYTDSNNVWVINTLPLEHYTWGMGETTGTGPDEHTKVMTVIFRTYGKWYIDYATKYAVYGFKIRSDSGSQIYRGYDWETKYPNIKKNAQSTRGIIATYGSETALTPYSSWSDGRTRSYKERWGSSEYPWCKSVNDPYGKHASKSTATLEAEGNHMVGLIANGSLNLADDHNWDYQRILKYYYSGISLNPGY